MLEFQEFDHEFGDGMVVTDDNGRRCVAVARRSGKKWILRLHAASWIDSMANQEHIRPGFATNLKVCHSKREARAWMKQLAQTGG